MCCFAIFGCSHEWGSHCSQERASGCGDTSQTLCRTELGKAGKENRGIFRVHQFEKVEQFCITDGDLSTSQQMLSEMLETAQDFYKALGIPHRVVKVVSGELNDAAVMKFDLEGWFAGQGVYRELVSCSNCTDFQSRALDIRTRSERAKEKPRFVHLLNATLVAAGRCLCCLLETYQTSTGVRVPDALVPFMGLDFMPFVRPSRCVAAPSAAPRQVPCEPSDGFLEDLDQKLLHQPYVNGFDLSALDLQTLQQLEQRQWNDSSRYPNLHRWMEHVKSFPRTVWDGFGFKKATMADEAVEIGRGGRPGGSKPWQGDGKTREGSDFEEGQVRKVEATDGAVGGCRNARTRGPDPGGRSSWLLVVLKAYWIPSSAETKHRSQNIPEINRLYETVFNQLTERYYNKTKWPSDYAVAQALGQNEALFLILYKELYYRHIYARLNPVSFEDRVGSWKNYTQLLDLMIENLSDGEDLGIALPAQWLWDILDEFVYHYQTYSTYCHKTAKMQKDKEVKELRDNPGIFETTKVLNYLHQLVRYSLIEEWLVNPDGGNGQGAAFTDEPTRLIGYFALMQLLRMHSLLGDYRLAMETIESIDFRAEVPLFYRIPACHVTVFYYLGFAYMMMRRYVDASRTFSDILVFLSKISAVNSLSYQYDQMLKKQDQMYVLLLICNALCPQPLDESLEKPIREKHADKQMRLQQGVEACFEDLFSYACPKFVAASMPDLDNLDNFNANEAHQRQLHLFLQEVRQQQALPTIGSYMKLYTSLQTSKLAQLCEMDGEGLRDQLMCVMHKTRQLVHQKEGTPLDGVLQPCGEVEFYLDGDMVHINAQKPQRPHADVFLEHIVKFQDILKRADRLQKGGAAA
ncbi:unnamed protein product [Durusdinium trenchii]|uniref:Eukaryotic translation initiation factor 3 subunit L n=1 Tax=Durusdinium trenchii TaxID=1381693 RepID=A0ABP0NBP4_9DINO